MLTMAVQTILNGLAALLSTIVHALPSSPFQGLTAMAIDSKWFGYLAYIVPIGAIVSTLEAWLICIATYYLYMVIMRWVKLGSD